MQEEQEQQVSWQWHGACVDLGLSIRGDGPTVVMLPALSSISTRLEMAPLQQRLASGFRTVAIDWPGFGDLPRPAVDWAPQAYADYLAFVLGTLMPKPRAVVAAGHAAGYALAHGCDHPDAFERLVLLAPTWRGPLPTMMKGRRPWFDRLCRMFDMPVLGSQLYRLNVNRLVVRYMAAGHVYVDPAWLDRARLEQKLAVTRAGGARCLGALRHRGARSAVEPGGVSRPRATHRDSGADGLRRADPAGLAGRDRGARGNPGHVQPDAAARQAVVLRGISRRNSRGDLAVPGRGGVMRARGAV